MTEEVSIFSSGEMNRIHWDSVDRGPKLRAYFEAWQKKGTHHFIKNSDHHWGVIQVGKHILPYTLGKRDHKSYTYLASFLSQYFDYTQEEVLGDDKYSPWQKKLAKFALPVAKWISGVMGMEKVVFVNNYLLSTNLYPDTDGFPIPELLKKLKGHFPGRAIVFRSVNSLSDAKLLDRLQHERGVPLVCRQLYMMNPKLGEYRKKRPYVMDKKLWEKTEGLVWNKMEKMDEKQKETAIDLYRALYLDKYSVLNPDYSPDYIEIALDSGLLDFYLLTDEKTGEIKAVQAVSSCSEVITTPFIGYDQTAPKSMGLYRLMNLQLMHLAIDNDLLLNMSSGAAKFKKQRGGRPYFEYHVVIHDHLNFMRSFIWKVLYLCSERLVKPTMTSIEV